MTRYPAIPYPKLGNLPMDSSKDRTRNAHLQFSATVHHRITKDDQPLEVSDMIGSMNIDYVKGQLLSKKHGRRKSPRPRDLIGDHDDTDYLVPQNGGV